MAERGRRPSVFKIGRVHDDGHEVHITGWGIGLCMTRCRCHLHPIGGMLAIYQDHRGRLGLRCFRPAGCDCCQPWEPDELADFAAALADIEALSTP